MAIEAQIFPKENVALPGYLIDDGQGRLLVDKAQIAEGFMGPFIMVADFGHQLEKLQQADGYRRNGSKRSLYVHREKVEIAANPWKQIALLANMPSINEKVTLDDPDVGILYASMFALGYGPVLEAAVEDLGGNITLIAPLRGGKIVQEIASAMGFVGKEIASVIQIRASRVILEGGEYLVGVFRPDEEAKITEKILFGDDCLAATGSFSTLLGWAREQNPGVTNISLAVGVAVQNSSLAISDYWNSQPGINFSAHAGETTSSMTDEYYLQTTISERKAKGLPESAQYTVGDMGAAMSLEGERGEIIIPIVQGLVNNTISGRRARELVERATRGAYMQPEAAIEHIKVAASEIKKLVK